MKKVNRLGTLSILKRVDWLRKDPNDRKKLSFFNLNPPIQSNKSNAQAGVWLQPSSNLSHVAMFGYQLLYAFVYLRTANWDTFFYLTCHRFVTGQTQCVTQ